MNRRALLKYFTAISALASFPSLAPANGGIDATSLGATGDGVTNDRDAIDTWFQAGGSAKLLLPAGHYRCEIGVGQSFSDLPFGTFIEGDGKDVSILEFVFDPSDTAAYFALFNLVNGNITFCNLTLKFTVSAGNKVICFPLNNSNITFYFVNCEVNVTCSAGVPNANLMLFNSGSGYTCEHFKFNFSKASGFHYTWLKPNTSTAINRDWHVSGSYFENNVGGGVNLNSPSGVFEGLWIENCTFGDHYNMGTDCFPISLASVKDFTITGNKAKTGARIDLECIHIEEAAGRGIIAQNLFDYISDSATADDNNGISIVENNIGGALTQPSELIITDNILRRTGSGNKGAGIRFVYNGSHDVPAKRVSAHGNYIENYLKGIQGGNGFDDVSVHHNHLKSCGTALSAYHASPRWEENTIEDCTTGLYAEIGGMWGRQNFKGSITTYVAPSPNGGQLLLGWSRVLSGQSHAGGNTTINYPLFPVGDRAKGKLRIQAGRTTTNTEWATANVDIGYNGTTLTASNDFKGTGAGSIDFTAPAIILSGGDLKAAIFKAGSSITDLAITADFDGSQQFT